MAKKQRYHQSRKDRRHESRGMEDRLSEYHDERVFAYRDDNRHHRMRDEGNDIPSKGHMPDHFNDEYSHDRGDERSLYRKFKALGNEIYAGMEPRRRQEMEDAGYIHEDHDAIANLPQGVIMRPYPKVGDYMPEGLDDTIRGVDNQKQMDNRRRSEHLLPKKY